MGVAKPIIAEVVFPASLVRCAGYIVYLDSSTISVRVVDAPSILSNTAKGEEGNISFSVKGFLHVVHAQFVCFDDEVVNCVLSFLEYGFQQRKARRVPITVRTSWRVTHSNNIHSAWFDGVTEDLSVTGMLLNVPQPSDVPYQIEALLNLSMDVYSLPGDRVLDPGKPRATLPEFQEIRVRGRVKHAKPLPFGKVGLGIFFTRIADLDKLRLLRFLADRTEEIEANERVA